MRALTLLAMAAGCGKGEDLDRDRFSDLEDCDDENPDVHPEASEVDCDGIDNDCDGLTDAEDSDAKETDCDGDGVKGIGDDSLTLDCDDLDANRFPGNQEWCDQIDNDCDDIVDNDPIMEDTGEWCLSDRSPVTYVPYGDPGCQCSSSAVSVPPVLALLASVVFARRRTARS